MKHMFSKNLISLALTFGIAGSVIAMEGTSGKKTKTQSSENLLTSSQELQNFANISMEKSLDQLGEDLKLKMNLIDEVSLPNYSNLLHLTSKEPTCLAREALIKLKSKDLNASDKLKYEQRITSGIQDAIFKANAIIDNFHTQISSLDPKLPEADRFWQETYHHQESLKNAEKYMSFINYIFMEAKNQNIQINDPVLDQSNALSARLFSHFLSLSKNFSSFFSNRFAYLNFIQLFAVHFKEGATRPQKEPIKIYSEQFKTMRQIMTQLSKTADQYSTEIAADTKTSK